MSFFVGILLIVYSTSREHFFLEWILLKPFLNLYFNHSDFLSMPVVSIASHSVSDNRNNVSQVLIRIHAGKLCKVSAKPQLLMGFNEFFQISSQALYPHNRKSILCLYKIHFTTEHILPASDDILITSLIQ